MRFLSLLALLLLVPRPATAADASFLHVWPGWRDARSFERIGEYINGEPSAAERHTLRTEPGQRDGYYFLVRVRAATTPTPARFELEIIRPDSPEPKKFTFAATLPPGETVFHLGLTGAAWPSGRAASPVAWRLALVSSDGRLLTEQKSFLWEKPAK